MQHAPPCSSVTFPSLSATEAAAADCGMAVTIDESIEDDDTDPEPERTAGFALLRVDSCEHVRAMPLCSRHTNNSPASRYLVREMLVLLGLHILVRRNRSYLARHARMNRTLPEEPVRLLVDREDHHIGRLQATAGSFQTSAVLRP